MNKVPHRRMNQKFKVLPWPIHSKLRMSTWETDRSRIRINSFSKHGSKKWHDLGNSGVLGYRLSYDIYSLSNSTKCVNLPILLAVWNNPDITQQQKTSGEGFHGSSLVSSRRFQQQHLLPRSFPNINNGGCWKFQQLLPQPMQNFQQFLVRRQQLCGVGNVLSSKQMFSINRCRV